MSKPVLALFAGLLWLALTPFVAWSAESPQKPYVVLDKSLSRLRADFNANAGKVRMLYIVGPTCGICLRGLSDLQEAIYAKKNDDPRLVTFVVHVPTLGAHEKNVEPASRIISNTYTTNYWEETGIIGKLMQQAMGVDIYLWDFWTIYDPQAVWSDEHQMPLPTFWQHQLSGRMPSDRILNANVFATQVDALLDRVPGSPSTGQLPGAACPGAGSVPERLALPNADVDPVHDEKVVGRRSTPSIGHVSDNSGVQRTRASWTCLASCGGSERLGEVEDGRQFENLSVTRRSSIAYYIL